MQINNIFILVNNFFANKKEDKIKIVKIIIKILKYLIFAKPIKFNKV